MAVPDTPANLPAALLAFHRSVGPIYKASQAKYGAFADLKTVLEAVMPPLLDVGLVLSQTLHPRGDGGTDLRTTLTHAASGEAISSDWQLPALDPLLERLHDLRKAVLEHFPLDLQLAAIGALPPVLPPRQVAGPQVAGPQAAGPQTAGPQAADPAAPVANGNGSAKPLLPPPSAAVSAAPAREPGLRLDDQLKGLYTLLSQLGTTTNPLHSIGGAVTYCRRYQILSLLCLAAEDNDGSDLGADSDREQPSSRRRRTSSSAVSQPAEPAVPLAPVPLAPSAPKPVTRSRKQVAAPVASPATPADQPAAVPVAPAPTAPAPTATVPMAPAPVATTAPPTAAPAPADPVPAPDAPQPPAADHELTQAEIQGLISAIRGLSATAIPALVAEFREHFALPPAALVSDYIRSRAHAVFINQAINRLGPVAV